MRAKNTGNWERQTGKRLGREKKLRFGNWMVKKKKKKNDLRVMSVMTSQKLKPEREKEQL